MHSKIISLCTLSLVFSMIFADIAGAVSSKKIQAFALINPTEKNITSLLDHSEVDGLALQLSWAKIETSPGVYNWTEVDTLIEQAKKKKKKITLHIIGSVFTDPPSWLKEKGAEYYSYKDFMGRQKSDIVPWDTVLLSSYGNFLSGLSSHLKEKSYTSTIYAISLTVPAPEMSLVSCRNSTIGSSISYDRGKYLEAWKTVLGYGQASFPKTLKLISAPVDVICHPTKDSTFYTDLASYIQGKKWKKFMLFATDLTAEGSDRMTPYLKNISSSLTLGYQTIWSVTGDSKNRMKGSYPSNLGSAICKAHTHGTSYMELYASDILNTDSTIQSSLKYLDSAKLCK